MKKKFGGRLPGFAALAAITLTAGLALGGTFELTEGRIREQAETAAENARKTVMPLADTFTMLEEDSAQIDWFYIAQAENQKVGYVAQTTVNGFSGPVEIIAGVNENGEITGVSVGGASFSETPGLGANAKNKNFTDRFIGKHAPVTVVKAGSAGGENTVDALTSATVTSKAVAEGVNRISAYVESINFAVEGGGN